MSRTALGLLGSLTDVREFFLPRVMTEGTIFRDTFGFTRAKLPYNGMLLGMVLCMVSKVWVNPWFDTAFQSLDKNWYTVDQPGLSEQDFFAEFYSLVWSFMRQLVLLIVVEELNYAFTSTLVEAIAMKRQKEFVEELLMGFSVYGFQSVRSASHAGEQADLSLVNLFNDVRKESNIISLWNSRLNTLTNFFTAVRALTSASPWVEVGCGVRVPLLLVLSVLYSFLKYILITLFEVPMLWCQQRLNRIQDRLVTQIVNVETHAEQLCFMQGEDFERNKLLELLRLQQEQRRHYRGLEVGKQATDLFIMEFEWLVPHLAITGRVRLGTMRKEQIRPCSLNFERVNRFLTWSKKHFGTLKSVRESSRRLGIYKAGMKAWQKKRLDIVTRLHECGVGSPVSWNIRLFNSTEMLAQGLITLPLGACVHLEGASGKGKTSLMRVLAGLSDQYEGWVKIPLGQDTVFLPSSPYILGIDEPLFQTISYPVQAHHWQSSAPQVVSWMAQLGLGPDKCRAVWEPCDSDKGQRNSMALAMWNLSLSDGERKRIAFVNVLLKLQRQMVRFLVLDEPFKGVDKASQRVMVRLLGELKGTACTVLFSNHEENHGFHTHRLCIDEDKEYRIAVV